MANQPTSQLALANNGGHPPCRQFYKIPILRSSRFYLVEFLRPQSSFKFGKICRSRARKLRKRAKRLRRNAFARAKKRGSKKFPKTRSQNLKLEMTFKSCWRPRVCERNRRFCERQKRGLNCCKIYNFTLLARRYQ